MKEDLGVSKAQAWGCPRHLQEIFKETQAAKLGDAPVHPLLHQQSSVRPSPHYIFINSYDMCYAWSVSLFTFQFALFQFCLLFITSWTLAYLVWERNTLHFHLECSQFSCLSLLSVLFYISSCCHAQLLFFMLIFLRAFIQVVAFRTLLSFHAYLVQRVGLLH